MGLVLNGKCGTGAKTFVLKYQRIFVEWRIFLSVL